MTATTSHSIDLLQAMVVGGARSVDSSLIAGQPTPVALGAALEAPGIVVKRSALTDGRQEFGLITVVPSSGLVSSDIALDAAQLTEMLVQGAAAGIAQAGGPALLPKPAVHISAGSELDLADAQAFSFELTAGPRSITVHWVVEATLGSLLGGSIPVDGPTDTGPSVAPATLPELSRAAAGSGDHDLKILSDVVTNVTVEIARGSVLVGDLTTMAAGTVFELDREAGDPVDVLVNGALVAKGDIVVVGNQLGIRINEIVEPN